jgi:hypothetical protein
VHGPAVGVDHGLKGCEGHVPIKRTRAQEREIARSARRRIDGGDRGDRSAGGALEWSVRPNPSAESGSSG